MSLDYNDKSKALDVYNNWEVSKYIDIAHKEGRLYYDSKGTLMLKIDEHFNRPLCQLEYSILSFFQSQNINNFKDMEQNDFLKKIEE